MQNITRTVPSSFINGKPIRYTADMIAQLASDPNIFVLIQRLEDPVGLAIAGGGKEDNETLVKTALREFKEETGMVYVPNGVLGTYTNHDPRPDRHSISTVFYGRAHGTPKNEEGRK